MVRTIAITPTTTFRSSHDTNSAWTIPNLGAEDLVTSTHHFGFLHVRKS